MCRARSTCGKHGVPKCLLAPGREEKTLAEAGSATTGLRRFLADRGCKGSRTLALLRSTQRNVATLDGRGYLPGVEGELGVGSLSLPSDTCRYLR